MIPKKLHFVWIGDESKRPDKFINTWRDKHPDWVVKVWGNKEFNEVAWVNIKHMKEFLPINICGAVDMMRYEILFKEGGIAIDADSVCMNKIDEHMLNCDAFAAWENEVVRPGLIANGTMGAVQHNPFIAKLILNIRKMKDVTREHPWKTVGPLFLTEMYRRFNYSKMEILPSYFFTPIHCSGLNYGGKGKVYAHQLWGSTTGIDQKMNELNF
jgi:mannosyltransferase OCH1-like enzyme